MERNKLQIIFFTVIFAIVLWLVFGIFSPFLTPLALAAIFAVPLYSLYERFLKLMGNRKTLAAIVVMLVASVVFITPLVFIGTQIFAQSQSLYNELRNSDTNYIQTVTDFIEAPVQRYFPSFNLDLRAYAEQGFTFIAGSVGPLVSGTFHILFNIFLIIFSLFFFLKDGPRFIKSFIDLSPLNDRFDKEIFTRVANMTMSVMKGVVLIALIQGVLVGVGFAIFGVPNATLWGSIAAVAALVPGIGTAAVVIPGVIYLFATGHPLAATGLIVWGGGLVGLIDNMLAPYIYEKSAQIHPLFILLSVLGGIALFGAAGFLFGPILLSLFFALLDIYRMMILEKRKVE